MTMFMDAAGLGPDPNLPEAADMRGRTLRVGSRVKHFGVRYTNDATPTVTGFRDVGWGSDTPAADARQQTWVIVFVDHDSDRCV